MSLQIDISFTEEESNQLIQVLDAGVKAVGLNAAPIAAITLQRLQQGAAVAQMQAGTPANDPEPADKAPATAD